MSTPQEARVKALYEAASWLSAFDQDLPGLDRNTCQRLHAGMRAMADSAAQRLHNVDGRRSDSGLPISDPMQGGARTVGAVAIHRSAPPIPPHCDPSQTSVSVDAPPEERAPEG